MPTARRAAAPLDAMAACISPGLLLLGVSLAIAAAERSNIPSYIEVCRRNDPKLEDCIIHSIERLRPKLAQGIPELGVPTMDPLAIPDTAYSIGPAFRSKGIGQSVYGLSRFKITKLKVDLANLDITVAVHVPHMNLSGQYEVEGQLLSLPIRGKGPINIDATDCTGRVHLKAQLVHRSGARYIRYYHVDFEMSVGPRTLYLGGLFNGDKVLGEATNIAINENSGEFMNAILPDIEKQWAEIIINASNNITRLFKFEDLFPEE